VETVRQEILTTHYETVSAVIDAGRSIETTVDDWPVSDPRVIREPLERLLRDWGLLEPLLEILESVADALDRAIEGKPVTSPPYLAVTSQGPVCRATLSDNRRLIVELVLFDVQRRPRGYRFRDPEPAECLRISRR
jgi:hypothetical protein